MLIVPVYEKGATTRDVPAGGHVVRLVGQSSRHNGGATVTRKLDLATMLTYVRAGSIIPFDPVRQIHGTACDGADDANKVFSGSSGEFTMYEDDGNSQDYMQNKGTWTKLATDDARRN